MAQAQSRFDGLLESVKGDQHKIGILEESLTGVQAEKRMLGERVARLERELSQQQEAQRKAEEEKEALLEARMTLKGELATLESQLNKRGAELEAGLTREQELGKELQHIVEVMYSDVISVEAELVLNPATVYSDHLWAGFKKRCSL